MEPRVTGSALTHIATAVFAPPPEKPEPRLEIGPEEAPLGADTPGHWVAVGTSLPASRIHSKRRRFGIVKYVVDAQGQRRLKIVGYGYGDSRKEAHEHTLILSGHAGARVVWK